jgi:cyclopropane-fatty-acyl-phospholipid synthase
MTERTGVATRLHGLLVDLFGVVPPVCIVGWDGSTAGSEGGPTIRVHSRKAVRRLLWAPGELGLARAYVAGEVDIDGDLTQAMRELADYGARIGSKPELSAADRREIMRTAVLLGAVGPAPKPPAEELGHWERGGGAREKIAAAAHDRTLIDHFRAVLGGSMVDSCAWFEHPGQSLDEAQAAKLERVCALLDLQPGQRLLDLGCGWGGLLVHAAQRHGVEAVGVSNNADRAELVRRRLRDAGLDDRVEVRLGDFSDIEDGPYDAIAALETTDHLPGEQVVEYAAAMQQLLRPGGRIVHQQITGRIDVVQEAQATFWGSYVHPDSHLLPLSAVVGGFDATGIEVRRVISMREHYPPTLRHWLNGLEEHWSAVVASVGEPRARVWRLSLALSTVGFERAAMSVHQLLGVRPFADGRSGWRMPGEQSGH